MQVEGILIGVRSYDFADKQTGNQISGVKVTLGVPEPDAANLIGNVVSELSADYAQFGALAASAKNLVGKTVRVECDVTLRGKATRLKAKSIAAA